ncbi:hypothetical protein BTO20_36515 (plasmid) [Mycobacterium dioxanotrophicus]|uniref:Uncharacterized protein n=1 Tax=Mycobacterium dioxanotrophicus TaxID=482462 RepID=A0A1Y0CFV2_9MYCO|nr:hypothetical protein [Mycobacterium dioxanotrophicus]ART74168.1 hypothetical protein BTO20_36515 [Mycobacterium dioxanotrophicus]OKH62999.1 hypothetical protein EB74_14140 [Mycobacterium sp. SWH-M5]
MPAINLDFSDDDYEGVRRAAERERVTIKSFARTAVLARTVSATPEWTLADSTAEKIPGLSPAAQKVMEARRGVSPDDRTYRSNGCLWLHLTAPAAVIAYPTAHYTSLGGYEFVLDRDGHAVILHEWSNRDGLTWAAGEARAQADAHQLAIAIGNHRLGIAAF